MSLIAWYKLDNDVQDNSGNDNHGTIVGSASYTTGKIGDSIEFNSARIETPILDKYRNMSFSVWFKKTTTSWDSIAIMGTRRSDTGWMLYRNSGEADGFFRWYNHYVREGGTIATYNAWPGIYGLQVGVWYHIVATRTSAGYSNLYVDGELVSMSTPPSDFKDWSYSSGDIYMSIGSGQGNDSASWQSTGMILDDVRIYDHALSTKEVKELAKAKVLHYTFNDFQEPTENLLHNVIDTTFAGTSTYGWSGGSCEMTDEITFNGHKVIKIIPSSTGSGGINATTSIKVPGDTIATMSMWVYIPTDVTLDSNWEIHRHALPDGICLDGNCHHYSSIDYSNKDWDNSTPKGIWFRRYITIKTHNDDNAINGYNLRVFCYANGANPNANRIYMTEPQVEVKPHPTPYTPKLRDGKVIDVSGYDNHAHLEVSNTPKWVEESKLGTGAYEFGGNHRLVTDQLFFDNTNQCWTVSAWVNIYDITLGGQYLNNFNLGNRIIHSGSNSKALLYINSGTNDSYTYSRGSLPQDQWIHIAFVLDTDTLRCQFYLNGQEFGTSGNYTLTDVPAGFSSTTIFGENLKGFMDDIRVYATALSDEDIQELYGTRASLDDHGNLLINSLKIEPLTDGLVGWWKLDGNADDSSGNNNNGTLNNVTFTQGIINEACQFDRNLSSGVTISGPVQIGLTDAITMCAWLNISAGGSWYRYISSGSGGHHPDLAILGDGSIGFVNGHLATSWVNSGVKIPFNQFVHVVFVFNSSGEVTIYVDGVEKYTRLFTAGNFSTSYPYVIGNRYDYNGEAITGLVDDVRIYNKRLSPEDIKLLYRIGRGLI